MNELLKEAIIETLKNNVYQTITLHNTSQKVFCEESMTLEGHILKKHDLEDLDFLCYIDNTTGNQQDDEDLAALILENMPRQCNIFEVSVFCGLDVCNNPNYISFFFVENCN